jgi:hypothetical protein
MIFLIFFFSRFNIILAIILKLYSRYDFDFNRIGGTASNKKGFPLHGGVRPETNNFIYLPY